MKPKLSGKFFDLGSEEDVYIEGKHHLYKFDTLEERAKNLIKILLEKGWDVDDDKNKGIAKVYVQKGKYRRYNAGTVKYSREVIVRDPELEKFIENYEFQ